MDNFLTGKRNLGEHSSTDERGADNNAITSAQNKSVQVPTAVVEGCEGDSRVEIVSEEGTIRKIIVTCSCGKVTELKCHY